MPRIVQCALILLAMHTGNGLKKHENTSSVTFFTLMCLQVCFSCGACLLSVNFCADPQQGQNKAQHLSWCCNLVVFFLLLTGLFTQNSAAFTSYSRQELLDIRAYNLGSFIAKLQLIPEISRTPEAAHSSQLGGSACRRHWDCKQRRGKCCELQARLRLIPLQLPLPSIFFANVQSPVNKMDELRLCITNNKQIMDSNVMIFTETWLNRTVPLS